jgi:hypothetical protein
LAETTERTQEIGTYKEHCRRELSLVNDFDFVNNCTLVLPTKRVYLASAKAPARTGVFPAPMLMHPFGMFHEMLEFTLHDRLY